MSAPAVFLTENPPRGEHVSLIVHIPNARMMLIADCCTLLAPVSVGIFPVGYKYHNRVFPRRPKFLLSQL